MQPSHAIGDFHFAPARLGTERLKGAYAWKSLLNSGAVVVGGSDAPVERGSPMIEFYAAVARKDLSGFSNADWHPEEKLTRAEALKLFTASAAYARFAEQDLGTIAVGKRADLSAFSADFMTVPAAEIPKAHAVLPSWTARSSTTAGRPPQPLAYSSSPSAMSAMRRTSVHRRRSTTWPLSLWCGAQVGPLRFDGGVLGVCRP
jgi:hypothetical protein